MRISPRRLALPVLALTLSLLAVLTTRPTAAQDLNGDGIVDALDLFEFSRQWQDPEGPGASDLLNAIGAWHSVSSATPTATPLATPTTPAGRVLRFPPQTTLVLSELLPGFLSGEVTVPVLLSDLDGVTKVVVVIPHIIDTGTASLVALISNVALGANTQDFTLNDEFAAEGRVLTITRDTPASHSGEAEVAKITFQVTYINLKPDKPDVTVEVPLAILRTELEGEGGAPLAHTAMGGVLVVEYALPAGTATPTPSTGSPTPTRTPAAGSPTPTPTAVPTPTVPPTGGKVLITVCNPRGLVGGLVILQAHFIDAQGRIANPGMPGGFAPGTVNVTVTGNGQLPGNLPSFQVPVASAIGGYFQIEGTAVGAAVAHASAPGFQDADDVAVQFDLGGRVSGQVEFYDAAAETYRPATFQEATIIAYRTTDGTFGGSGSIDFANPGSYTTTPLEPGNYNILMIPIALNSPHAADCIANVQVVAGQTTGNVNGRIGPRSGNTRFFGNISHYAGVPLNNYQITMNSGASACGHYPITHSQTLPGPVAPMPFEIPNVPAGLYNITVTASNQALSTRDLDPVMISGAETQRDFTVYPRVNLNAVRPVNYARVSGGFPIEWQAPPAGQDWVYAVTVFDRCGQLVWDAQNLSGTSVNYGGPALDPTQVYNWYAYGYNNIATATTSNSVATAAFIAE